MELRTILVELVGGYGIVMVLGAYALNTFEVLTARRLSYQLMNLTGGIAFIYYTLIKMAWASLFVNIVWVIIAFIGIVNIIRSGQETKQSPA